MTSMSLEETQRITDMPKAIIKPENAMKMVQDARASSDDDRKFLNDITIIADAGNRVELDAKEYRRLHDLGREARSTRIRNSLRDDE